jgi:hypothetical protein
MDQLGHGRVIRQGEKEAKLGLPVSKFMKWGDDVPKW